MRKHLIWMIALGAAVAVAGVAQATDSTGSDFSELQMKATPSKQDKKKRGAAKLFVETSTLSNTNSGTPTSPGNIPKATTNVKLTFPKDFKFTNTGLAQCDAAKLENTTTASAKQLCGKAQVGAGQATACIGSAGTPCSGPGNPAHFVVTAFNGKPKGGNPTIVLHSRSDALTLTTILVGTLDQKTNVLNVPIPPSVYSLATITDFQTTVQKAYKNPKGGTLNYVSAKCSKGSWTLKGEFKYTGGDPTDNPSVTQKCSS
jgi:hypothetical protein